MNQEEFLLVCASTFLLWLLFSSHFVDVVAMHEDVVIGVKQGDWAKYGDISIEWNSTDPNAKPDQELIELNDTLWFQNIVTEVDNLKINFNQTRQLKNGTQKTSVLQVDLDTGLGSGALLFIPAELLAGEMLYPNPINELIVINETALRISGRTTRLVNHLNLTRFQSIDGDPPQNIYISINYYWDRETGILTERFGAVINITGSYQTHWTRSDKIIDTNLWSGEETEPPKAIAGGNRTVYKGSPVIFDASASSDNVAIVSYHWDFGDETSEDGAKVTHVYTETGTYMVILIVKDASGNMALDSIIITVEQAPPNGFPLETIGAAATVAVILAIIWMLRSRKKR